MIAGEGAVCFGSPMANCLITMAESLQSRLRRRNNIAPRKAPQGDDASLLNEATRAIWNSRTLVKKLFLILFTSNLVNYVGEAKLSFPVGGETSATKRFDQGLFISYTYLLSGPDAYTACSRFSRKAAIRSLAFSRTLW